MWMICFCKMGLGRAEQNCTLCVHVISCLYCTVQLPGATLLKALCYEMRRSSMFSKAEELQNWLHTRRRSTAQVTYRALGCARAKNLFKCYCFCFTLCTVPGCEFNPTSEHTQKMIKVLTNGVDKLRLHEEAHCPFLKTRLLPDEFDIFTGLWTENKQQCSLNEFEETSACSGLVFIKSIRTKTERSWHRLNH